MKDLFRKRPTLSCVLLSMLLGVLGAIFGRSIGAAFGERSAQFVQYMTIAGGQFVALFFYFPVVLALMEWVLCAAAYRDDGLYRRARITDIVMPEESPLFVFPMVYFVACLGLVIRTVMHKVREWNALAVKPQKVYQTCTDPENRIAVQYTGFATPKDVRRKMSGAAHVPVKA